MIIWINEYTIKQLNIRSQQGFNSPNARLLNHTAKLLIYIARLLNYIVRLLSHIARFLNYIARLLIYIARLYFEIRDIIPHMAQACLPCGWSGRRDICLPKAGLRCERYIISEIKIPVRCSVPGSNKLKN
ncbi:MAG: hypothetical protein JW894_06255 [Bacteroidales bacterium]|nr:hypothetical protein [Bacteroidales bacterium]